MSRSALTRTGRYARGCAAYRPSRREQKGKRATDKTENPALSSRPGRRCPTEQGDGHNERRSRVCSVAFLVSPQLLPTLPSDPFLHSHPPQHRPVKMHNSSSPSAEWSLGTPAGPCLLHPPPTLPTRDPDARVSPPPLHRGYGQWGSEPSSTTTCLRSLGKTLSRLSLSL